MTRPWSDTGLLADIQRFGAADVSACFSCGTCTATCPLVTDDATFPRRMIRYAQVGLRDKLLSSKELWTCYACGECSETLSHPGRAERVHGRGPPLRDRRLRPDRPRPDDVHAAVRRDVHRRRAGRLLRPLHVRRPTAPQSVGSLDLFGFIPEELIHNLGIGVMVVVFLAGLAGVATMARRLGRAGGVTWRSVAGSRAALRRSLGALWSALAVESLGQRRYRADCDTDAAQLPWFRRRWFLHAATMWGFLGLLAATILDYGLALVGDQGHRHAGPDLVPGPPARHRRRPPAGLRREHADRPAVPRRRAVGPPLDRRRLDVPGPHLDHRGHGLRASRSPSICRARPPGATGSSSSTSRSRWSSSCSPRS